MFRLFSIAISVIAAICISADAVYAAESTWQKSLAQGNDYTSKQAFYQAERSFRQAVSEIDKVPHMAEDKSNCMNALANVLALEDKTSEAESTLFQSLHLLEQAYGKNSSKLVPTLFAIGSVYESIGNHTLAMHFYSRASDISEKHYTPYCPAFSYYLPHPNAASRVPAPKIINPFGTNSTALKQQATLTSSEELKKSLPAFNDDILKNECTSNQDLLNHFEQEFSAADAEAAPNQDAIPEAPNQDATPAAPNKDTAPPAAEPPPELRPAKRI